MSIGADPGRTPVLLSPSFRVASSTQFYAWRRSQHLRSQPSGHRSARKWRCKAPCRCWLLVRRSIVRTRRTGWSRPCAGSRPRRPRSRRSRTGWIRGWWRRWPRAARRSSTPTRPRPSRTSRPAATSSSSRRPRRARRSATTCRSSTRCSRTRRRARSTSSRPRRWRRTRWPSCTSCWTIGGLRRGRHGVLTYDGDTPPDARRAVRDARHIVLTNPDMLHAGHPAAPPALGEAVREPALRRDRRAAHLPRRVRQPPRQRAPPAAAHLPPSTARTRVFICSSATIANPRELAERLIERAVRAGRRERRARGARSTSCFVNPPVVNARAGHPRARTCTETRRVASDFLRRATCRRSSSRSSRLATEVLTTYLKDGFAGPCRARREMVRGYRGGYLPQRAARDRARPARRAHAAAWSRTNALELGIDIGALDVSSWPATRARSPRPGSRRAAPAAAHGAIGRGAGRVERAARPVHRAASRVLLRRLARARARSTRTTCTSW